jgi:hypothetical protein
MLAVRVSGVIVTGWKALAIAPLWSVTVTLTVYVPLTAKLVEKPADVPDAGLPPTATHE